MVESESRLPCGRAVPQLDRAVPSSALTQTTYMALRYPFFLCLLALVSGGRAQTGATLFAPVPLAPPPADSGALIVSEESARRALALGFASAAAAQAVRLLDRASSGSEAHDAAALILCTARLELGDEAGAVRALAEHSAPAAPAHRLRAGLIAAREARWPAAQAELALLRSEFLPEEERAWFWLLQGMTAEGLREATKAGEAYDQAVAAAVSDWQRARLRLTRERLRLEQGAGTETQAAALREQAERYAGRGVATDYAVQYAVALTLLGRGEQAVAYLQAHLNLLPEANAGARDDVRLMLGLIAGPSQVAGRSALEQLLGGGADAGKRRMALHLLAEGAVTSEARQRLRRTLDELLAPVAAHPLTEELLLVRAELALGDQDYGRAESDAKALLARFSASPLRSRALTQLATVAWELRRFRTAADYAGQAAVVAADAEEVAALRLLSAEASYRAQDYAAAAAAYAAVTDAPPAGTTPAAVMFQRVLSEVDGGRLVDAARLLDRLGGDLRLDPLTRWQAEWNLARALQAAGQPEVALDRLAALAAEPAASARPAELRARLAWLRARLAQDAGRQAEALELARALESGLAEVEAGLAREVAGLARLVEAEALFGLGRGVEAVARLKELRANEPGTDAMVQSFLVEADYQARAGNLVEAQGLLIRFADDYRDHPNADYAIFQAALNAERRGEEAYYREAYVLLEERLVRPHPRSELFFAARLKQGDLLRRLGDFAAAQQIYESLVNQFSQHPDVLSAQIALADCHRAQAAQEVSHFESAITLLERLRDLADAPADLRAEAGFKLGDMLATRDVGEALAAWWPVVDALLVDRAQAARLGDPGRYWLGRLLARMAGVLEEAGRPDEAGEAWRMIVDRGLPGAVLARARLAGGRPAPTP